MDTGRILDIETMSRYCQSCVTNEKFTEPEKFEVFKINHAPNCMIIIEAQHLPWI